MKTKMYLKLTLFCLGIAGMAPVYPMQQLKLYGNSKLDIIEQLNLQNG